MVALVAGNSLGLNLTSLATLGAYVRIHEAWTGTFLIILLSTLMIQSRRRDA